MANIGASELRKGYIVNHNNAMWKVVSTEHVKPGKGGAFIQTEMKNIKTGSKLNERFRSEDKVDRLVLESVEAQFSYKNGNDAYFLRMDSFEEISLNYDEIGDDAIFLVENLIVKIEFVDEIFIGVIFPDKVKLKVVETELELKGSTVTSVQKPAIMNNGMTIMVPGFIKEGEELLVSVSERKYVERA